MHFSSSLILPCRLARLRSAAALNPTSRTTNPRRHPRRSCNPSTPSYAYRCRHSLAQHFPMCLQDTDVQKISRTLDNDFDASTPCTVARRASIAQGRALLTVWERSFKAQYASFGHAPSDGVGEGVLDCKAGIVCRKPPSHRLSGPHPTSTRILPRSGD